MRRNGKIMHSERKNGVSYVKFAYIKQKSMCVIYAPLQT